MKNLLAIAALLGYLVTTYTTVQAQAPPIIGPGTNVQYSTYPNRSITLRAALHCCLALE